MQEEEGPRDESDIHDPFLEDMEIEIDIDKMFPDDDQLESTALYNPEMEITRTNTLDEEEYFSFQSVVFYSEAKTLVIEKRGVKNKKGKYCSENNLRNMCPSQISQIHRATRDTIDNSISSLET